MRGERGDVHQVAAASAEHPRYRLAAQLQRRDEVQAELVLDLLAPCSPRAGPRWPSRRCSRPRRRHRPRPPPGAPGAGAAQGRAGRPGAPCLRARRRATRARRRLGRRGPPWRPRRRRRRRAIGRSPVTPPVMSTRFPSSSMSSPSDRQRKPAQGRANRRTRGPVARQHSRQERKHSRPLSCRRLAGDERDAHLSARAL